MQVTTSTTFQNLPSDIRKNYLVGFLDPGGLLAFSSTCREYVSLARNLKIWISYIYRDEHLVDSQDSKIIDKILILFPNISGRDFYLLIQLYSKAMCMDVPVDDDVVLEKLHTIPYFEYLPLTKHYPLKTVAYIHCLKYFSLSFDLKRDNESLLDFYLDLDTGGIIYDFHIDLLCVDKQSVWTFTFTLKRPVAWIIKVLLEVLPNLTRLQLNQQSHPEIEFALQPILKSLNLTLQSQADWDYCYSGSDSYLTYTQRPVEQLDN